MKGFLRFLAALLAVAVTLPLFRAEAQPRQLTIKQERLMGLPNRFFVEVREFPADGPLTTEGVSSFTKVQLDKRGINLVPWDEDNPPARVIVHLRPEKEDPIEPPIYLIDVNVYNMVVIQTKYELRKGTIWHLGSYRVEPGEDFPKGVEKKLKTMLRYLAEDYFAANPYQKQGSK